MVDSSENNFNYVSFYWHMVAHNINEFIIPECQEACISLWARNIGTFMCSNRDELSDISYILLNDLSEENKHIIDELIKKEHQVIVMIAGDNIIDFRLKVVTKSKYLKHYLILQKHLKCKMY